MWYEFNKEGTEVIVKHPKKCRSQWEGYYQHVPQIIHLGLDNDKYLTYVKTDKNGTKHYKTQVCAKCLGYGKVEYKRGIYVYDCRNCNGTGKLKRAKTYKIHTHEYGKVLEQEYIKKQNETFYKENCINKEDASTYCYIGNTYSIKTELKEKGAKYNEYLGWHSTEPIEGYPYIKVIVPIKEYEDGTIGLESIIYPNPNSCLVETNPKMIEIKEKIKKASKEYLTKEK